MKKRKNSKERTLLFLLQINKGVVGVSVIVLKEKRRGEGEIPPIQSPPFLAPRSEFALRFWLIESTGGRRLKHGSKEFIALWMRNVYKEVTKEKIHLFALHFYFTSQHVRQNSSLLSFYMMKNCLDDGLERII